MSTRIFLCLLAALTLTLAQAADEPGSPAEAAALSKGYVPGNFASRADAEDWLARAQAEKDAIEERYAHADWACYDRFFVFRCLNKARDARREALAHVEPIIIDANRYIRKIDYEEHMRALNERNREKDMQIRTRAQQKSAAGS